MLPVMENIASFLSSNVKTYVIKPAKDFKCWEIVYNMIVCKNHLNEQGRLKIRLIVSEMKSNKE